VSSRPFDATFKDLIEGGATAWPTLLGPWPFRSVEVVDADVSTVTAAADKVLLVHGERHDWLLHLEPQSSRDIELPERLHLYNVLMRHRHRLPVRSVVLLLRPEANAKNLTGELRLEHPDEKEPYEIFRYRVVRLWEMPLEPLMTGDMRLLPLAGLSEEATPIEAVIERVQRRLRNEAAPGEGAKLAAAFAVLLGLRYTKAQLAQLETRFPMPINLEDSSVMQMWLEQARLQGARQLLLELGEDRFGPPNAAVLAVLEQVADLDRLKQLAHRIQTVSNWEELIA
jgi:predicted transposase YdaD